MEDKQVTFIVLIGLLCLVIFIIIVACLMLAKRYDSHEQEADDKAQIEYLRNLREHKEDSKNNAV